jgi:hypothetical protein
MNQMVAETSTNTKQLGTEGIPREGIGDTQPLAKLVTVALEGKLPLVSGLSAVDAEMERDFPLPSTSIGGSTTDAVVIISGGPDQHVFAGGEAMKI